MQGTSPHRAMLIDLHVLRLDQSRVSDSDLISWTNLNEGHCKHSYLS